MAINILLDHLTSKLLLFYKLRAFQQYEKLKSPQSKFSCESYASCKLTYPIDHHDAEWTPCQLKLITHVELVLRGISRRYRVQNANTN